MMNLKKSLYSTTECPM